MDCLTQYASPVRLTVTWDTHPITSNGNFVINGLAGNETLVLYKGVTYQFEIDTPEEHGFWIKTELGAIGFGAYTTGLSTNGINNGVITWTVDQSTPDYLVYQSSSDESIYGLLTIVVSQPLYYNQLQKIDDLGQTSLPDLVAVFNYNVESTLSLQDSLAGRGLRLNNRQLELDVYGDTTFYLDTNGDLMLTSAELAVDDQVEVTGETQGLIQTINYLASVYRALNDPAQPYYSAPAVTLKQLEMLYIDAKDYVDEVESTIINLRNNYRSLEKQYKALSAFYLNHSHDAEDIKFGVIAPARLGIGTANTETYLRGDSRWSNLVEEV